MLCGLTLRSAATQRSAGMTGTAPALVAFLTSFSLKADSHAQCIDVLKGNMNVLVFLTKPGNWQSILYERKVIHTFLEELPS